MRTEVVEKEVIVYRDYGEDNFRPTHNMNLVVPDIVESFKRDVGIGDVILWLLHEFNPALHADLLAVAEPVAHHRLATGEPGYAGNNSTS